MWMLFAAGSAVCAGLTAVLAKCGIRNADSNVVTAIRTSVVLLFAWLMVFLTGVQGETAALSSRNYTFLILSGLSTGVSWLCYFKALQLGDVNKVAPIDKSSTILTMLLAFAILSEPLKINMIIGMAAMGAGTYLMIQKRPEVQETALQAAGDHRSGGRRKKIAPSNQCLLYAAGSAVCASLTSILAKIGIDGVDSNLGTAIRTGVVLIMAWAIVFITKKQNTIKQITKRDLIFIILSGLATGASWLCYFKALQDGPASIVVPVDKLSIVVTVAFSYFILHERLTKKALLGLLLLVGGSLTLLIK